MSGSRCVYMQVLIDLGGSVATGMSILIESEVPAQGIVEPDIEQLRTLLVELCLVLVSHR